MYVYFLFKFIYLIFKGYLITCKYMGVLYLTTETTRLVLISFSTLHIKYYQMPINKLCKVRNELYQIYQILPYFES